MNTCSVYVLTSRVTNRTIVQLRQSQVVQLYGPPNLHIYEKKLNIFLV